MSSRPYVDHRVPLLDVVIENLPLNNVYRMDKP
jgi:hypothetical protein